MFKPLIRLAALLAALPLALQSVAAGAQAPDRALAPGTVISSADDIVVGGWRKLYQGTYPVRAVRDRTVTESAQCCFATFEKGMALMVVRTEVVSRNARGEPLSERIVSGKWITRRRGESVTDCQILWISPQLSLYDNKTGAIRSVVLENGQFVVIQWRDPGSYCSFGD